MGKRKRKNKESHSQSMQGIDNIQTNKRFKAAQVANTDYIEQTVSEISADSAEVKQSMNCQKTASTKRIIPTSVAGQRRTQGAVKRKKNKQRVSGICSGRDTTNIQLQNNVTLANHFVGSSSSSSAAVTLEHPYSANGEVQSVRDRPSTQTYLVLSPLTPHDNPASYAGSASNANSLNVIDEYNRAWPKVGMSLFKASYQMMSAQKGEDLSGQTVKNPRFDADLIRANFRYATFKSPRFKPDLKLTAADLTQTKGLYSRHLAQTRFLFLFVDGNDSEKNQTRPERAMRKRCELLEKRAAECEEAMAQFREYRENGKRITEDNYRSLKILKQNYEQIQSVQSEQKTRKKIENLDSDEALKTRVRSLFL